MLDWYFKSNDLFILAIRLLKRHNVVLLDIDYYNKSVRITPKHLEKASKLLAYYDIDITDFWE